ELTTRVLVEEVPDAPNDVKVVERGSKSVTLKIEAPYSGNSELVKYIIQWKKQKDNWESNSFKHEFSVTSHQYAVDSLQPRQTYNIRVYAVNAIGESKPGATITVTTEEEGEYFCDDFS
ncbi:cell adhesion molecule-like protein, partial [Leptotrombidium deliense]